MPHVLVKMYPGSTHDQKVKLAAEITQAITLILQKSEAAISIGIVEVAENEWMEQVYDKEIRPNFDVLYKKPGY